MMCSCFIEKRELSWSFQSIQYVEPICNRLFEATIRNDLINIDCNLQFADRSHFIDLRLKINSMQTMCECE